MLCTNTSNPIFTNVTIKDNSSTDDGGGLACFTSSSPVLTNVAITNN